MSETLTAWIAVVGMAVAAAVASARLRWLSAGGSVTALAVGLVVLIGTGVGGVALLLVFFLTSSALTKVGPAGRRTDRGDHTSERARAADDGRPGGKGRTAAQVLANGGVAAVASAAGLAGWLPGAAYVVAGSLAAATADTWATELGTRIGARTRLVTTWRVVPPGRSGGVSWPGSAAAAAGAGLIGVAAALVFWPAGGWSWLVVGATAGAAGTVADSFAGAGLEGRLRWVDNHVVNGICTLTGGSAGWIVGRALLG